MVAEPRTRSDHREADPITEHVAGADRPWPKRSGQRPRRVGGSAACVVGASPPRRASADESALTPSPRRTTVYTSRARDPHSDARAWVPFPNADSLQTLEDLLDDDELVPSGQMQAISDTQPAAVVTAPKRERAPAPKRVRGPANTPPPAISEPRRTAPLTRRGRRQHRRRRQRRRIVFAALVFLTAATIALDLPQLLRHSSQVTIRVDGKVRVSAQTDANNVAGALREHNVKVNAEDRVRPRPTAKLSDGMTVEVFRSFPIAVNLDGVVTPVATTWAKPAQLLEQLHLDPDKVSIVTAPTRLTDGASVAIHTLRRVTVSVHGTRHTETTPALNVGEFLEQNRVALGPDDEVSPSADTALADGMSVTVSRIVKDIETYDEPLPPPTVTQDDPAIAAGEQGVVQEGVPGTQRVVYQITKKDGQAMERTPVSSEPIQPPTPKIIAIGIAPANSPPG
jgi:resuscitation-promoting factor RpfB